MHLAQVHIRRFIRGEELALWIVCYLAIHKIACKDYTADKYMLV